MMILVVLIPVLGDIYERRIVENMSLLSSVDIFASWKDYEISFLASSLNEAKYTRNQVLFRQDDTPDYVYFIKSGEVEVIAAIDLMIQFI